MILVLGVALDFLGTVRGRPLPANWLTRLGGVALVIVAFLQLSGHLIK